MAHSNKFTIALTRDQKIFLNSQLPKKYSLQIQSETQKSKPITKTAPLKKIQTSLDENKPEYEHNQTKRRKTKSIELTQHVERKSAFGKKEEIMKKWAMIKKIKKHQSSWPFRAPVNTKNLDIPNYHDIVITPMDLHTIQQNLKGDLYEHPSEIERDINQIILNSYKFNNKNEQYFQVTKQFEEYYKQLLKENEEKVVKELPQRHKKKGEHSNNLFTHPIQKQSEFLEIQKSISSAIKQMHEAPYKRKQKAVSLCNIRYSKHENTMTIKQKRQLAQSIRAIDDEEQLLQILRILRRYLKNEGNKGDERKENDQKSMRSFSSLEKNQQGSDEEIVSIDIEKIDVKGLKEVQNFLKTLQNDYSCDIIKQEREDSVYFERSIQNSQSYLISENTPHNNG